MEKIGSILAASAGKHRRTLVVTDGVFSMDGDIAPLPQIIELADRHGALVLVDDAHGTGVLGERGAGTVEHFGLPHDCCIQVGTLSKALGSLGGFVCGSRTLIDYLRNRARSILYTTGLPASVAGAALASIEIAEVSADLRQNLRDNTRRLVEGLQKKGVAVSDSDTPIIPLTIGESEAAVKVSDKLFKAGVYCPALRPPTVPEGTARLRISLMATHTEEDIEMAVEALSQAIRG
jgi:7-keto-8-aminopelargonate synthetase-like enzyme